MKIPLKINKENSILGAIILVLIITVLVAGFYAYQTPSLQGRVELLTKGSNDSQIKIASLSSELTDLKNQDQVKINQDLNLEVKNINKTYQDSIKSYERVSDLKIKNVKTPDLDKRLAQSIKFLSDRNYTSASASLSDLAKKIDEEEAKLVQAAVPTGPTAAKESNTPPGSGVATQLIETDMGSFTATIIAADLNSTKVIVDTAADGDCGNGCAALSVGDYASRSGAYAAINGSFFCPPEYPSCSGKTNSFDTLLMNKNKHYFNSDNNVYSTVPAAIFSAGSARFVGQSLEWGRDTGVDAVIANYPLLLAGGNISYSGSANEPKFGDKGNRAFIASKGNMVYIGYVFNATMVESAHVMKALGFDGALNLDEGGSSALWSGGRYLVGPGRNVPNAVLFIKR